METTAAGAAALEVERFEWAAPDRIEIAGYWSGLRGLRFVRPTLVVKAEGEQRRLLALLEHKPWTAHEGELWVAAFAWDGEVVKLESAELNVGSGIDLDLPPPKTTPGKPRRFRQRVAVRDASRGADPAPPQPAGLVSDAPEGSGPKLSRAEALKRAKEAALHPAARSDAPPAADPPAAEPSEEPAADPAETLRADVDRVRGEREALRRERDQAVEKLRALRGELEAERQARETAVAGARSEERASANRMLAEGAELRAAVERQREIAYLERDDAFAARDEAIAARARACEERDAALAEAKEARQERKEAIAQRDRAFKTSERAVAERDRALRDRDAAIAERAAAVRERDEIVSVHERGLPVHPPKPRFLPDEHEQRSGFDIWGPRLSALAVLLFCAFIVLRVFGWA